jgi:uncharacterized membrane protein
MLTKTILILLSGLSLVSLSCKKSDGATRNDSPYFPKVKAIISANCLSCHTPGGQGMPVDLTQDQNIVNLAQQIKSATVDPPSPQNRRMPQGGELSQADKDIIVAWFNKGGKSTD